MPMRKTLTSIFGSRLESFNLLLPSVFTSFLVFSIWRIKHKIIKFYAKMCKITIAHLSKLNLQKKILKIQLGKQLNLIVVRAQPTPIFGKLKIIMILI